MTTTTSSKTDSTKKITKVELNQLAKSGYGEDAYCEHVRTGQRGWYLYQGTADTAIFLGANANEAFDALQSQELKTDDSTTTISPQSAPGEEQETHQVQSRATKSTGKSSTPPQEMLEILMEKFPNTFFRDPEKIKPIQKYIHKKIRRALNNRHSKDEISAALAIYTQQIEYCQKLMEGGQRVDIEGNPCGEVSQQHQEDARARVLGAKPMRQIKKKKPKPVVTPQPPKDPPQLEKLVAGRMDLCVKINRLPSETRTIRNGWQEFLVDTSGPQVKVTIKPKTWKKLCLASETYPIWLANIKGKMGFRIRGGFELEQIAVQIFEKKKDTLELDSEVQEPIETKKT
jgi:ProP effector